MKLSNRTLEKLRIIINGDDTASYRKGYQLVSFFNELGFQDVYGQGFPSRWVYTDDRLQKINGTPELDKCIRKALDDMRLSFELLVKDLLGNDKSLENQIALLGGMLKDTEASVELRNMVTQVIKYYTDFQNNHVKHNDKVNSNEIEYVIELTSVVMKFLIKISGGTN